MHIMYIIININSTNTSPYLHTLSYSHAVLLNHTIHVAVLSCARGMHLGLVQQSKNRWKTKGKCCYTTELVMYGIATSPNCTCMYKKPTVQ
jgi:hypothetical protein